MVRRTNFELLEEAILRYGRDYGPSFTALLLYGPFGMNLKKEKRSPRFQHFNFTQSSKNIINKSYDESQQIYDQFVIPKMHELIGSFCYYTPSLNPSFEEINGEILEEIILNSLDQQEIYLPEEVEMDLFSKKKPKTSQRIDYYYDRRNNILITKRKKLEKNIFDKFDIIFNTRMKESDRTKLMKFALSIARTNEAYWKVEINEHKTIEKVFGNAYKLMVGDNVGFKVIYLDQQRATSTIDFLANERKENIDIPGFVTVKHRYDDHRKRVIDNVPGGLHWTFTDARFPNWPVEVQVQDFKSLIFDLYGPNKHQNYIMNNKKTGKK